MSFAKELRNLSINSNAILERIKEKLKEAARNEEVELTILFDNDVEGFTWSNFYDGDRKFGCGKFLNILKQWAEENEIELRCKTRLEGYDYEKQTGWTFSWQNSGESI